MVDQLKGLGLELIKSKKFAAVVTGCAINLSVLVAAKFGIGEEQAATIATQVSGIIMTYIIGQGIADHGKEAKKVEIAAAASTEA